MKKLLLALPAICLLFGCVSTELPKSFPKSYPIVGAPATNQLPGHIMDREYHKFVWDSQTNVAMRIYVGAPSTITNKLPLHINDREFYKFTWSSGTDLCVRVVIPDGIGSLETDPIFTNWLSTNAYIFTLTTTDATTNDIVAINVATGKVYYLEANVIGRAGDTDRALYHREALFYRATGVVTQEGSTTSLAEIESESDWGCTLNADTNNNTMDVRVFGAPSTNINWRARVKWMEVQ